MLKPLGLMGSIGSWRTQTRHTMRLATVFSSTQFRTAAMCKSERLTEKAYAIVMANPEIIAISIIITQNKKCSSLSIILTPTLSHLVESPAHILHCPGISYRDLSSIF